MQCHSVCLRLMLRVHATSAGALLIGLQLCGSARSGHSGWDETGHHILLTSPERCRWGSLQSLQFGTLTPQQQQLRTLPSNPRWIARLTAVALEQAMARSTTHMRCLTMMPSGFKHSQIRMGPLRRGWHAPTVHSRHCAQVEVAGCDTAYAHNRLFIRHTRSGGSQETMPHSHWLALRQIAQRRGATTSTSTSCRCRCVQVFQCTMLPAMGTTALLACSQGPLPISS